MSGEDILNIGEKLRAARKNKNFSLRKLAALADVSPSLLSQIENGHANPSVMTLYNVASALAIPITFFFPDSEVVSQERQLIHSDKTASELRAKDETGFDLLAEQIKKSPVVTSHSRMSIELLGGVRWERLTVSEEEDVQFLEIQYRPGAASGQSMSRHSGREFGFILSGELKLELGFERYLLKTGDSIMFQSNTPHRLSNEGDEIVRAIWVLVNRTG